MSSALTVIITAITTILSTFSKPAAEALLDLCKQAHESPDPAEFLRRKAKAELTHKGAQATAKAALKKKAKKKTSKKKTRK